jgi:hypothetical protein
MPSASAGAFLAKLDPSRRRIGFDYGLILTRIILAPPPIDESFWWFLSPPEVIDTSWTWYIDGSFVGARLPGAGRTGFGIVIVAYDGTLIAYGSGNPPDWVLDASGAEAWALYAVIRMCNDFPRTITDCLNLLTFLEGGQQAAGASHKPLARLWNMIFPLCDDMVCASIINKLLIWMPSHNAVSSIGTALRSDGKYVTAIDWRANRLVDRLAKLAAAQHGVPDIAMRIFGQAHKAAEYCAAFLGTVTHRANHHSIEVV